jgi:hypothetical protein
VYAQVRSKNINGWSDFSEFSLVPGNILTEPADMQAVTRGSLTDIYNIHVEWKELQGDDTRGSPITSYFVQWDKASAGSQWYDLVGLTDPYLQLEYLVTYGDLAQGVDYQFRIKAVNAFGFSQNWSPIFTIDASDIPDPVGIATTSLEDEEHVRIEWVAPADNFKEIERYQILIMTSEGESAAHSSCDGSDPSLTHCVVSMSSLRQSPFFLVQNDIVQVTVRAQNSIGWGAFSQFNLLGQVVNVEPYQLETPSRGALTSEEQIQILWTPIENTSQETGGSAILSYNLQWKQKNSLDDFADLVGQDGAPSLVSSHIQTDFVVAGVTYSFRVRARNALGFGLFSNEVDITAAKVPEKPAAPSTSTNNVSVRISWVDPDSNSSPITGYEVMVATSTGDFIFDLQYCNAATEPIISQQYCEIPVSVLRTAPYFLVFDQTVYAKFRASNIYGWSVYSESNSEGAQIQTEPIAPQTPTEDNTQTNEFQLAFGWP